MFVLSECILFILIIIYDSSFLKYLSIGLCLLYSIYRKRGYLIMLIIMIADYCLLLNSYYILGIMLFMIVQMYYHYEICGTYTYFYCLLLFLCPSLYFLATCYAIMSVGNIYFSLMKKHWLRATVILLALCDLCIMIQYLTHYDMPIMWLFYLPSQVLYVKKVSVHKLKPLKRNRNNESRYE